MEQFVRISGVAAPLMRANIDTDLLIPSKEMTGTGKEGYGEKLLAPWRYLTPLEAERQQDVLLDDTLVDASLQRIENPDFVLNKVPFRQSVILIAGENFGSGSSREMAVWALRQFGFRCVIAPSFGAIFRNNCFRNGVLPVVLPAAEVQKLANEAEAEEGLVLTVDLTECRIFRPDGTGLEFTVPPNDRNMLLEGLDAIGVTLKRRGAIEAFQAADRIARPWIWAHSPAG
ncbi:MAG: 3-isopropylmalate dehydratase small subunit [Pseudomonadota bacterium]|nr:3-isopropylmalate dehydratase small subunit [Pseudomonadota bacterium]